ncbi:hypothetical protein AgCh_034343 [Apium graveolens]
MLLFSCCEVCDLVLGLLELEVSVFKFSRVAFGCCCWLRCEADGESGFRSWSTWNQFGGGFCDVWEIYDQGWVCIFGRFKVEVRFEFASGSSAYCRAASVLLGWSARFIYAGLECLELLLYVRFIWKNVFDVACVLLVPSDARVLRFLDLQCLCLLDLIRYEPVSECLWYS